MSKWKSSCPEIDVEEGPYPTEEWIDKLGSWKPESFHDARLFFCHDLPEIFDTHLWPYGTSKCVEDKDGRTHLYLATGGWSGCEEVLSLVNNPREGRLITDTISFYAWMWEERRVRGGAYWWVVPGVKE